MWLSHYQEVAQFVARRPRTRPTPRVLYTILAVLGLSVVLFSFSQLTITTPLKDTQKPPLSLNPAFALPNTLPRIAKLTMLTNIEVAGFELSLKTHKAHGEEHGYPVYVCREEAAGGAWDKIACLLSVVLDELMKPSGQRLEWIMWFDADTIITNPHIPLEIFLPPPDYDHTHLLLTRDWNGPNAGVFLLRVHPWSYDLLARVAAYPAYRPDKHLDWAEQGALVRLLDEDPGIRSATLIMPRVWFNAYQDQPPSETRGRLLVHFPGQESKWKAVHWFEALRLDATGRWAPALRDTSYEAEIGGFWETLRRAGRVLGGFGYTAEMAAKKTSLGGDEAVRAEFEEKERRLREGMWGVSDKPVELERLVDEAVEANKKLVLTWSD